MARPSTPDLAIAPAPSSSTRPIGFHAARNGCSPAPSRDVSFLFHEVLAQSPEAGAYYLGRRLQELFPDRALIETSLGAFDVESYAWAGHCTVVERSSPAGERMTSWHESDGHLWHQAHHVWLEVRWGDELLDVVVSHRGDTQHSVVLARTQAVADEFLAAVCRWNTRPRQEAIMVFNGHRWFPDHALWRAVAGASLDTLILRPGLKEDLWRDITSFFTAQETYRRYGVAWRRGLLLLGPPGNGKTHAVKAFANAAGRPCLYVRSIRSPHGTDEDNIRAVFARARSSAPCLLVLEDLDALITDKNRSFFLNEMDGFEGNDGILTLATTNHPERIDPAIIDRPSRFDRKYSFDLPGCAERGAYLESWNERLEPPLRLSSTGLKDLAETTSGFSFAYLKELLVASTMCWIGEQRAGSMDAIARAQVETLRTEMARLPVSSPREEVTGEYGDG